MLLFDFKESIQVMLQFKERADLSRLQYSKKICDKELTIKIKTHCQPY